MMRQHQFMTHRVKSFSATKENLLLLDKFLIAGNSMKRKLLYLLFSLLLLLTLTGCDREDEKKGEYQIYYLNM